LKRNSEDWGPPYGEKASSLFHCPLIPMAISFAGGILAAHEIPLHSHVLIAGLFSSIAALLVALLVSPPRLRGYLLLFIFFLAGALLIQGNPSPSGLIPLASQDGKAVIEGTVLDPVKIIDNRIGRFTLCARGLCLPEKTISLDENIAVTVYRHLPDLHPGNRIRFPARLRLFRNFNNPGNYDYKGAMKLKGLTCAANVSDGTRIVRLGPGRLPFFRGLVEGLQRPVREFFRERLNPRSDALFRALILGERQGVTFALRESFNQTGLGHLLAVSGLHIGLVAGVAFFLFKWILSRSYRLALSVDVRKLAALLTCFPVIGYALLAGFQVSSQRAMIMVLAFLASLMLGREREVWSTLSLAGLIILLFDPNALFSVSFQLSFMAVIGILWLTPAILKRLHRPVNTLTEKGPAGNRLLNYFIWLTAVSAAAAFFLLPVTCHYFHRIPLVSIPANLTTVPILGMWVIPVGLLSAVTVPFSTGVAGFILQIGAWGLTILMSIIELWANLPWSSIWMVTPNLFEILLFYSLIFCLFFFRRFRWARMGLAIGVVLILSDVAYWVYTVRFNRDLQVTFLDVGKGNAALVSFPGGKKMLIDGGGFASGSFDVGEMVVAPYLWHSKILRIDYLVLSHPQADHMNGLRFIARFFRPKEFWHNGDQVETPSYKELMAIVDSRKIRKMLPTDLKGNMQMNGARVEVLHPDPDSPILGVNDDGKRLNNNSLVLKITYGNTSFLFPGDLEKAGEEALIAHAGQMIQSDILLSPHHGSKTSSSKKFLELVKPRLCIISSGERTVRNFPHSIVLKRLRDIGCHVLRIALSGAVTVTVRQDQLDITTFVDGRQSSINRFPERDRHDIVRPALSGLLSETFPVT
jgi:competence protein ComEC